MIKITSVEINGFITAGQKVKLDFIESNIICIYGENGSGKTTFLEILFAVFDENEEILKKYNVNSIVINYKEDTKEIEKYIEELKFQKEKLESKLLKEDKKLSDMEDEDDRNKYKFDIINPIEQNIDRCQDEITKNLKNIDNASGKIEIKSFTDNEGKTKYIFDSSDKIKFNNLSSLFLGIGRGVHKKKVNIPRNVLWYFFNDNRKINENKKLTGNEIDDFTDKLLDYLGNAAFIETDKANTLDDKRNIYLPYIEIDTIEAFLINKYKETVLDAKESIKEALFKVSINSFKPDFQFNKIDLDELKDKLIYNKALLLEIFAKDENMGIEEVFSGLNKDDNFLEHIDGYKQIVLLAIINELQSEVEKFKEIQTFLDEYNSFLNYDKKLTLSSDGIFIIPQRHSIERLSSGERHLLAFLATILLMGEEQDFILIDEPEISLNVKWQRNILSTIVKLAPNAQIIVATHSPLVVEEHPQSLIELMPEKL